MNNMFNNNPEMTISFVLFILCAFGFAACYESPTPEQEEQIQYKMINHCASRSSGSSPRCWSDADWDAYCSRVNCK
mgnify:CR=1 FL=1